MITVAKEIKISDKVAIGGRRPLFLIGGPCVLESRDHALRLAEEIGAICQELGVPFVFKSSFDKANRSSIDSFRGPGLEEGLRILDEIKHEFSLPVLSDVHETAQIRRAAEVLDIIQIPALLCRQTDLITEAADTGKPLNIKKGQFMSPGEVENIVKKAASRGNHNLLLTERGTVFGYHNLVFDVRSIPLLKALGYPVIIDASHTVQRPGGQGTSSGGEAEFIATIARAGISAGCDGIFCEIHDHPEKALSDGYNSFNINGLRSFLSALLKLKKTIDEINANE